MNQPRLGFLYRYAIRRPRRVLLAAALATGLLATGLPRLTLSTDGRALVPLGAQAVQDDLAVRRTFGLEDPLVLVVESSAPEGIYTPDTLELVAELSRRARELDGIEASDVVSIATASSDRVHSGTMDFRPWLSPVPATEVDCADLRRRLEDMAVYRGTLISRDSPASAAAILVGFGERVDRRELCRQVEGWARELEGRAQELHVVGSVVAEATLGDHVARDLAVLVPAAILLMALVFRLAFRSWTAALLPVMEVGACIALTFSAMAWIGVPVYLPVAVLPVILTAIGVADEVHVFHAYVRQLAKEGHDRAVALVAALDEVSAPVVRTSITTAVAFLSFAASPLAPVRAFGAFMALGIGFCLAWTLCVVPACLSLVSQDRFLRAAGTRATWALRMRSAGELARRYRVGVLAGLGALAALAPVGMARLRVQDSWTENFARTSRFHRSTERVNELFAGTHLLHIEVDADAVQANGTLERAGMAARSVVLPELNADPARVQQHRLVLGAIEPDSFAELAFPIAAAERDGAGLRVELESRLPDVSRRLPRRVERLAYAVDAEGRLMDPGLVGVIGDLERFLAERDELGVGAALGPESRLRDASYLRSGWRAEMRRVPEDRARVEQLLEHYALANGDGSVEEWLTADRSRALVTAFLRDANFDSVGRLMRDLDGFAQTELAPRGLSLRLGGDVVASQAMIGAVVETQVTSLAASLLAVFVVALSMWRSVRLALAASAPAALAVLVVAGGMAGVGVPLGVATSTFAAMTVGVGVDFAIHLIDRWRTTGSVLTALERVGPAIGVDALAVGLGFGVLVFSQVPSTARLGAIALTSVAVCFVVTAIGLPAAARRD